MDLYTVLTMTDTVDEEELQAAEEDIGLMFGTHNTMRHISISHVCNANDIHDKKKAQVVRLKIRMFLNEMMSDDTESHSEMMSDETESHSQTLSDQIVSHSDLLHFNFKLYIFFFSGIVIAMFMFKLLF